MSGDCGLPLVRLAGLATGPAALSYAEVCWSFCPAGIVLLLQQAQLASIGASLLAGLPILVAPRQVLHC